MIIILRSGVGSAEIDDVCRRITEMGYTPHVIRGEFKTIRTSVPGILLGEVLPLLAKQADKYTLVRSVGVKPRGLANHGAAIYMLLTGYDPSNFSPTGLAVPPSREVYRVDSKTWTVELRFPTAGNRPHGIGWEGRHLWVTDSNLNAFFKHDPETGEIREKIQLADNDPLPHGMTIRQGWLWYCDYIGVVCRLKLS